MKKTKDENSNLIGVHGEWSRTGEPLKSFEDVNAVILNIAALRLNADKKENEMNTLILATKSLHEPEIKLLKDKIAYYEDQLQSFGKANKKLFKDKRSVDLTYGRVGFRSGKKSLRLINPRKYTWEYVKEKLSDLFATRYVKVKTTLKKTEVLNAFEKGLLTEEVLTNIGAKVVQGEEFFYKINWDEIKITEIK